MKITIYQNREVYKEESKIGNDSENKVETLEFEFPEEYEDFTKYIEFQIKGEKYVDLIENNKYVITREVAKYGKIKTQVVLKKNTENDVMVFKSDIFTLNVSNSINATENLVNTVGIDLIEKIVGKNYEQDVRLDALEADSTNNIENISNLQNDNTTNKINIKSLQDDNEVNKTDISNIKQEQTVQNTNIQELQTDNTSNKSKIVNLEMKNAEQDTNIQKNTESIAQLKEKDSTQDKLIEQLQAENTKLKKEINSMQIPGEATGKPIHLSDSSDMECEIVPIGGAEQETREGYNQVDVSKFTATTKNGVTITKDVIKGSLTLNGTATSTFAISIPFILEAGTIISYSLNNSQTKSEVGMRFGTANSTIGYLTCSSANAKQENFELTEDITDLQIRVGAGSELTNFVIYPQVEISSTLHNFEIYGAMPSPEFKSQVKTVGQNVNLLENKAITQTINGVTFTVNKDGSVMVNGTATTNTTFKINDDIVPKNISNLILSGCPNNGSKSTYDLKIELYKNGVWTKVLYDFGNGVDTEDLSEYTSCTISTTIRKDYNANNLIFKPKLEKGSIATPYSPYGMGSVGIDVANKNLLNIANTEETTKGGITYSIKNGILKLNGTATANFDIQLSKNIKIKKGKYTHSSSYIQPGLYVSFDNLGYTMISAQVGKKRTFEITEDTTYKTYFIWIDKGTVLNNVEIKLQLEVGDTATDPVPHESQIAVLPIQKEFVKIGDVEDTFVKVDGKWYEKHNIKKLILNGTEDWKSTWQNAATSDYIQFVLPSSFLNDNFMPNNPLGKMFSSHFSCYDSVWNQKKECIALNETSNLCLQIKMSRTRTATLEEFKTWLSNNNVTVYYILSEPELIPCTTEQESILNSFYTYKNVTNISVDGIGTLKVNYKKDLETLINNLLATSVAE